MVKNNRANKKTSTFSTLAFESDRFRFEKNQETYEKLHRFRSVWAERKVILDELDREIRSNFERRGWLSLMDIEYPPLTTLIREFYSNLSVHSDDSNTHYIISWIRGEKYVITSSIVASALGIPLVWQPKYPYSKNPPLDDIMSCLTSTCISWGTNPCITSHELTELNYLFSEFLVIRFGLSLTCTPFLLRDVHFCMPLWLMLLCVFLLFSFIL